MDEPVGVAGWRCMHAGSWGRKLDDVVDGSFPGGSREQQVGVQVHRRLAANLVHAGEMLLGHSRLLEQQETVRDGR